MNLLYRTNESKNRFVPDILDRLHTDGLIDKCVVVFQGDDTYDESYCIPVDPYYGYNDEYDKICDLNALPAVSGSIWEKLLPYKDNTLNMMCRHAHNHIMYYDEMEEEYIRHVMYWNDILDRYEVGLCFFSVTPHTPWEYVIYSLARVKGIPTLLQTECNVHDNSRIGTCIEKLGENTNAVIRDHIVPDISQIEFSPEVRNFYDGIKNAGLVDWAAKRDELNSFVWKWVDDTFVKPSTLHMSDMVKALKYIYRHNPDKAAQLLSKKYTNTKRLKDKKKKIRDLSYYDSHALEPDYNERYVYYAYHYQPEETTLPMGGVYNDQYIAVKMLADTLAGYGIKLYVKENWMQISRRKYDYDRLMDTPNVRLIRTDTDTAELMKHAVAVSSISGTCLHEGIIRHIPALGFSTKELECAPGYYPVKDVEDIKKAMDAILAGECVYDDEQVLNYFKAYSITHIPYYLDYREVKSEEHFKRAQEAAYDLIRSFIQSGLNDDFIYTVC